MGGDPIQALRLSLADPPYQTKTEDVKVRARLRDASCRASPRARASCWWWSAQNASYAVVAKALSAIKEADMDAAINGLSLAECDVLMKYIYRGLGQPAKDHTVYQVQLTWHDPARGLPSVDDAP